MLSKVVINALSSSDLMSTILAGVFVLILDTYVRRRCVVILGKNMEDGMTQSLLYLYYMIEHHVKISAYNLK